MRAYSSVLRACVFAALAGLAHAHIGPFHPAMYCLNGTNPGVVDYNNAAPVQPLYMLNYSEYWMHHINNCDMFPPDDGVFLELPAGGNFTVELANNRAFTSLNSGAILSDWPDGQQHPSDFNNPQCITHPNMHTQNRTMAAGTAFAIAYKSNIHDVTLDDLVIFSVRYHTPWHRVTSYDVPPSMPPCPDGGCVCVWGWIPHHCGEPNMYMFPIQCNVIPDSTPPKTIGSPKPAVWCDGEPDKCTQGPKNFLIWNQAEGNNIEARGYDASGQSNTPAYNEKCGFKDGAQLDIYVETPTGSGSSTMPAQCTPASASAPAKRMTTRRKGHGVL